MPEVKVNDIDMYYEIHGDGKPLILIEGWGMPCWMWQKQTSTFSKYFQTIVFDNRGMGGTNKPEMQYSIKLFADDLAGLMKALEIPRAHILGVSMGGFIAQTFALDYPQMVGGLVLGATAFGGPNSIPMSTETLALAMTPPKDSTRDALIEAINIRRTASYSLEFLKSHVEEMDQITDRTFKDPQPESARNLQAGAGIAFNEEARVEGITSPTLIVAGENDRMVPPKNSELLMSKISFSKLVILKDAQHMIFYEYSDKFNDVVLQFLQEVDSGKFNPEPRRTIK